MVVVSALGDTTDDLQEMAFKISKNPPEREMDMLMSTGEQISCSLLAMAIITLGHDAISFTGKQVGIRTDKSHTKARIETINARCIHEALKEGKIVIVAGYQGVSHGFSRAGHSPIHSNTVASPCPTPTQSVARP